MFELKQTEAYEKWETRLRDKRARTIIAARLMRLVEGVTAGPKLDVFGRYESA